MSPPKQVRKRPSIAFFDHPDVFEDFYSHYGVDQQSFATHWAGTGSHAFVSLLQREVGDVTWYAFSVSPKLARAHHEVLDCEVRILSSSWLHRSLWRAFYLPRPAWRWRRAYPLYATLASYASLLSWHFIRTLRHDRPDFLFLQDYSSGRFDVLLLLGRALGIPVIAYHAGSKPEDYAGKTARQWTIRRAYRIIASSNAEADMLKTRYRVDPSRLTVILTPIDVETFRPASRDIACQRKQLASERRYFLFVGRLDDRVKRIGLLIRTFAGLAVAHPDVDLLIVGEGRDGAALREQAATLAPGRIHFAGWTVDKVDLALFYNVAECLVLPSLSEGFPTVVGEAMSCGTPVIASRVGGVGEMVVEGETGWTFPADDERAFASRLEHAMGDAASLAAMRDPARRMAEQRVAPSVVAAALRDCFPDRLQKGR